MDQALRGRVIAQTGWWYFNHANPS